MNPIQKLQKIFNPALAKQNEYKERAKARGLLSLSELNSLILDNPETIKDILAENKDIGFVLDTAINSATMPTDLNVLDSFERTSQVIFDNKNFHNLNLSQDDLEYLKNRFLEETKDDNFKTLNVNHSQFPEDSIGYFDNLEIQESKILADTYFTNTKNSKLQDQFLAVKNGAQLGYSIEIGFASYSVSEDGKLSLSQPYLKGLATTLIPSAPETLTNLSEPEKTDQKDLAKLETDKKLDESTKNLAEAGALKLKDFVNWNLGDGLQIGEIIAILKTGEIEISTSADPILATETDPVALIRIYRLVDEEEQYYRASGTFTAHLFSNLDYAKEPSHNKDYWYDAKQTDKNDRVNFDGQNQKNLDLDSQNKLNLAEIQTNLSLEIQKNSTELQSKIDKIQAENLETLEILKIQNQTQSNYESLIKKLSQKLSSPNSIKALL